MRRRKAYVADMMPTDAEVWALGDNITWSQLAIRQRLDYSTLRFTLSKRGWRRGRGGSRLLQAPCAQCGQPTAAEFLTQARVCTLRCETEAVDESRLSEYEQARRLAARRRNQRDAELRLAMKTRAARWGEPTILDTLQFMKEAVAA